MNKYPKNYLIVLLLRLLVILAITSCYEPSKGPQIVEPGDNPENKPLKTLLFWNPNSKLNQDAQKNIIDSLISEDDKKQIDIFEHIGKDIEKLLTTWSDEKLKNTVLLFMFKATAQDRLEGYDPKILNQMYALKKNGNPISLAGKAIIAGLQINNAKHVKTIFTDKDLEGLGFVIQEFNSDFTKTNTIIGAFRIIFNDKKEVQDIDQNKQNIELFNNRVLQPLKNL